MSGSPNGDLTPVGGGDAIPLIRAKLVLGRRESCDICLRYPNVSSKHCELTFETGFWYIRDLNSTNGIKVNDKKLQPMTKKFLGPKDQLTIAKRKYIITYALPHGAKLPVEDEAETYLGQTLLQKAGLERRKIVDPANLFGNADDDDDDDYDDDDD